MFRYLAREKIAAIVSRGGEPDPDAPNDMNSMRFWTTKMREESQVEGTTFSAEIGAAVNPNSVLPVFGQSAPVATLSQVPDVAGFLRSNPLQDFAAGSTAVAARALTALFAYIFNVKTTKNFHVFLFQIYSRGPGPKNKARAKPKASAEGKGPLGLKLAGKSLADKIAAARWGLTSPFPFSISPFSFCSNSEVVK